jgi:heat shock protein HslJ
VKRLAILALVLSACSQHVPPSPNPGGAAALEGTSWRLDGSTEQTLMFPEPGKIAGKAACNRYFGSVEVDGEWMRIAEVGSTKMACADDLMARESRFLEALANAELYALDGEMLTIWVAGADRPLRFTREH